MDLYRAGLEFPVIRIEFPAIPDIFPVNSRREFVEKWLQRRGFLARKHLGRPPNIQNTLLFSLLAGNLRVETGSHLTAHTTTTHTLKLYRVLDARNSAAISKAFLPNSLVSAVSASAIEPNEAISPHGLCSKKFRS
jgi:hypothetical protein